MARKSFLTQLTHAVLLTAFAWGFVWFLFAVTP